MAFTVIVQGVDKETLSFVRKDHILVSDLRKCITERIYKSCLYVPNLRLQRNGTVLEDEDVLFPEENQPFVTVHVLPNILGGKGGFGALIRAMGKSVEKSNNRDACRDLSGRRVRDVQAEKKLTEWVQKGATREGSREDKIKKIEKKLVQPKHVMNDPKYMEQMHKHEQSVQDALKQGLRATESGSGSSKSILTTRKRPSQGPSTLKAKKSLMWMGVDGDEEDLSSEEDEEDISSKEIKPEVENKNADETNGQSQEESLKQAATSEDKSERELDSSKEHCPNGNQEEKQFPELNHSSEPPNIKDTPCEEPFDQEKEPKMSIETDSMETAALEEPIDLDKYKSAKELENLGADRLKMELMSLGLKCGGTLQHRAERLFSTKGKAREDWSTQILAKTKKK